jgi:hypothetical protein
LLAKVQYPGPDGSVKQFDVQVPDNRPAVYRFTNPDDGSHFDARLVNVSRSSQSGGDVAIYEALPSDD